MLLLTQSSLNKKKLKNFRRTSLSGTWAASRQVINGKIHSDTHGKNSNPA